MTKASDISRTELRSKISLTEVCKRKKKGYLKNTEKVFEIIMTDNFLNWSKKHKPTHHTTERTPKWVNPKEIQLKTHSKQTFENKI